MFNVTHKVTGTKLDISIDLSKNSGPSKSGKSIVVASTHGNLEVSPGVFLGVNCYKK